MQYSTDPIGCATPRTASDQRCLELQNEVFDLQAYQRDLEVNCCLMLFDLMTNTPVKHCTRSFAHSTASYTLLDLICYQSFAVHQFVCASICTHHPICAVTFTCLDKMIESTKASACCVLCSSLSFARTNCPTQPCFLIVCTLMFQAAL